MGRAVGIPIEAQPLHSVQNRVDVFGIFFFWVGVVKAHVADTPIVARQAKIQANAFGMPNVQIAVGLRGEPCANFGRVGSAFGVMRSIARRPRPFALRVSSLGQIGLNDLTQKITHLVGVLWDVCRFDFVVGCAHGRILEPDGAM